MLEFAKVVMMITFQVEQIRVPIKLNSNPTVKKQQRNQEIIWELSLEIFV